MTLSGTDVSAFQPATPNLTGSAFVFVKATEGTYYVSPTYRQQIAAGRAAFGYADHYVFLRPGNIPAQVAYFKAHADVRPGELIAVDWESTQGTHPTCAEKDAAIKALKATYPHNKVGLYCNTSFWKSIDTTSYCGDFLWIADPNNPAGRPNIQHPWTFQQWGITGGYDRNVANFSNATAFKTWRHALETAPVTSPTTKPVAGPSLTKWTDRTTLNGHTVNYGTLQAFRLAQHYMGIALVKYVIQGSYNGTNVGASAGTHAGGGALDFDVRGWSPNMIAVLITWLRFAGFAAWHRLPSEGPWIEHVHAILAGDPDLSQQAAAQVIAYRNGRNGLATNAPDTFGWRPTPFRAFTFTK